ncbi:PAS domain S-box protein [Ideonella sp. TBM-1]|uniref:histidine kinase n=2 Tax=Ideonella livida TaxID=2707176 RepID=A0A7C9PIH3_9BURK|nr:PAS domain S-box protein [Ideonella livida]
MMAALVLVGLVSVLLLYAFSAWRLEREAEERGSTLARERLQTLVQRSQFDLRAGQLEAVAARLAEQAQAPGVVRLDVWDAQGRPWMSFMPAGDQVQVVSRPQHLETVPAGEAQGVRRDASGHYQAWTVLASDGRGGAGLRLSLHLDASPHLEPLDRLRDHIFFALVLVSGLAAVWLGGWLHLLVRPLHRLVQTATAPGEDAAQGPPADSGCAEVDELARALRGRLDTLHRQHEALQQAEARTSLVIHAAPDALMGLDDRGAVTLVNHAVTSVFGCTEEQIVGQPLARLLPGMDAAEIERVTLGGLFMRSSQSHLARLELTARRHDGTEFPAEASLSRVVTPEGPRYACVVRDLTEQRMTMGMLELYNRALECTTNGIVISDMSLPGEPIFYANPAFTRITGYQPWEAIGKKCGDLLLAQDRQQPEIEQVRRALAAQEAVTVVLRNYRKDGSLFFNELALAPVRASDGSVRHYVGIQTDVSERERSRLALAERNARLNAVFDLSPDGYAVFDREGQLVFANQALLRMTGWEPHTVAAGMSLAEFDARFGAQCDPARPWRPLAGLLTCGVGSYDTDDLVEVQSPQRLTLTRLARLNIDGRGESILYFRDVTREMEVDRMKSEFLTTAAHELRTPMVSVFGFTELLLNRPVPEARRRDVLETIHRQASLLISMVNELLDLARIEARQGKDLKREPLRLAPVLEQAVQSFMVHGDPRKVVMEVRHPEALLLLDPEKTHRALTNVVSNAFKYSPQGGEIRLSTLDGEVQGEPAVGVRVSDQGIGMTPAQLARVFERFYRADPSGNIPGTGLGMSLVKEITELQGGRVEVQSAPGVGTEVTLWFPLMGQDAAARTAALG